MKKYLLLLCIILITFDFNQMVLGKRLAPEEINPVIFNGVKYIVLHWGKTKGLEQNGGYVEAIDIKSNKSLWKLQVYKIKYQLEKEKDVQDIFITSMVLDKDKKKLILTNELNEIFYVNIGSKNPNVSKH